MLVKRFLAQAYINQAHLETNDHYRFGQALWNLLPDDVTLDKVGEHSLDFFYEADNMAVLDKFFKHFVENTLEE